MFVLYKDRSSESEVWSRRVGDINKLSYYRGIPVFQVLDTQWLLHHRWCGCGRDACAWFYCQG